MSLRFHYNLTDDDRARVVDNSNEREPLVILFGHGKIIPGLEQAMDGHAAGDRFDVVVAAGAGLRSAPRKLHAARAEEILPRWRPAAARHDARC